MGRKNGTSLDKHVCMSSCLKNSHNVEKQRERKLSSSVYSSRSDKRSEHGDGLLGYERPPTYYYKISVTTNEKSRCLLHDYIYVFVYLHTYVIIHILLCVYCVFIYLFTYLFA
jgi:hypothetical protein